MARELSAEDKLRRVVLKRVNLDRTGVRSNFLKSGTMARGAAETGKVRCEKHAIQKAAKAVELHRSKP